MNIRSNVRAVTTCVEYDDLLKITLIRNLRYLREIVVVTSPHDERTQELVNNTPGARLHCTDAFYLNGAMFNRGLAIEQGFDCLGREGWILVMDADILLPQVDWSFLEPGRFYSAWRRVLRDPTKFTDDLDWTSLPLHQPCLFAGYFQLFHASDKRLDRFPWYPITSPHAAASDQGFHSRWKKHEKFRTEFDVLHLGHTCTDWCGRITPRVDGLSMPEQEERTSRMRRVAPGRMFGGLKTQT